jgi:hypothetical protein
VPTTGLHAFRTHPNFNRNWINGTIASDRLIRLFQESMGKLPPGLKGIHVGIEAKNSLPVNGVDSWFLLANRPAEELPNLTLYAQVTNQTIVNSGYAVIGRYAEPVNPQWVSDVFYARVGNTGWYGVNIDLFAAEQ